MLDGITHVCASPSAPMPRRIDRRDTPQAKRLLLLRKLLKHETEAAFAGAIGISPQRWNNFVNGAPLTREVAFRLVKMVPGLTLDWLYFGKSAGLPLELARELGEFPAGKAKTG